MVVLPLPKYAVFKSKFSSKFLSYRPEDKYLCFSGDEILSPNSKFAIEPTNSGNGLVHVRCCYNNKYFVRDASKFVVVAGAPKPGDDTLLEPLALDDDDSGEITTIRFRDVQTGYYVSLFNDQTNDRYCLFAMSESPNKDLQDAYEVIDWETLVRFPPHDVAFKGVNGKYLGSFVEGVNDWMKFSVSDKSDARAAYRVEPAGNGSVYIYSKKYGRYFSNDSKWSVVGLGGTSNIADESSDDPEAMMFWPIKLEGGNVIALRSCSTKKFLCCDRYFVLASTEDTIKDETHITVEEAVVSRSIYNIVYRQDDARVYNEVPIVCGTGEATNDSDQQDNMQIPIKYTETKTTSWDNSVSIQVGLSTTIETGVPFIANGEVSLSLTVTGEHKWGGKVDASFENGVTYTAVIGPRTHVKLSYIASRGTCDVPFSYTQADTYSDGTHKITVMNDGLYTGVNCYNYSFVKKETPL